MKNDNLDLSKPLKCKELRALQRSKGALMNTIAQINPSVRRLHWMNQVLNHAL